MFRSSYAIAVVGGERDRRDADGGGASSETVCFSERVDRSAAFVDEACVAQFCFRS